jgi:hypothetical protein
MEFEEETAISKHSGFEMREGGRSQVPSSTCCNEDTGHSHRISEEIRTKSVLCSSYTAREKEDLTRKKVGDIAAAGRLHIQIFHEELQERCATQRYWNMGR